MIFKGSGCFQFPEAGATTGKKAYTLTRMQFTASSRCFIKIETATYKCNNLVAKVSLCCTSHFALCRHIKIWALLL